MTATLQDLGQSKGKAHLHIGASVLQRIDVGLVPFAIPLVIRSKGVKGPTAQSSRRDLICQPQNDEVLWEVARCSWQRYKFNFTGLCGKADRLITNPNVLVQQCTCNA